MSEPLNVEAVGDFISNPMICCDGAFTGGFSLSYSLPADDLANSADTDTNVNCAGANCKNCVPGCKAKIVP